MIAEDHAELAGETRFILHNVAIEFRHLLERVNNGPVDLQICAFDKKIIEAKAQAAGKIADLVLIPVTASGVDLLATGAAVDLIRQARTIRHGGAPKCLIVPSKIDRRTDAGRRIDEQLGSFGEPVAPTVNQRTAFVEAFGAGLWIGDYAPDSSAHYDIRSLAIAVKRSLRI